MAKHKHQAKKNESIAAVEVKPAKSNSGWLAIGIVLLLVALIRLRLLDIPLERDEGEYAYMGSLIMKGIVPYTEAYNMKLPGTGLMYAILMAIFGKSVTGIHAGLLLVNTATSLLYFISFRKLFNLTVAFVAAAAYAILTLSPAMLGFAAHATQFVSFFVALSLWLYSLYNDNKKSIYALYTGFALGMAMLMKQQAVFFILFGAYLFISETLPLDKKAIGRVLLYTVGLITPYLITVFAVIQSGSWDKFWFWTYTYASTYASGTTLDRGIELFNMSFAPMFKEHFILWLCFFAGIIIVFISGLPKRQKWFVLALLAASFLSICPGFYFRRHYFITLLPAAVLLMGITADYISNRLAIKKQIGWVSITIIGISFAMAIGINQWYYIQDDAETISKTEYGTNPFTEAPQIADYIATHSKPDDKIAVVGSEPEIYFYANRRAATGYMYTYSLMELHKNNQRMQQEMIDEITKEKPEYLVFCKVDMSWLAKPGSPQDILKWFFGYTKENYALVGAGDVIANTNTHFVWGDDAAAYAPKSDQYLLIFKRNQ